MEAILSWAESGLHDILTKLSFSPFRSFMNLFEEVPYLGYINYFVPISTFISILEAWTVCIGVYYLYSIALRWVKAIE